MGKETREQKRAARAAKKNCQQATNFTDEFVSKINTKKMVGVASLSVLIYLGELALSIIKED